MASTCATPAALTSSSLSSAARFVAGAVPAATASGPVSLAAGLAAAPPHPCSFRLSLSLSHSLSPFPSLSLPSFLPTVLTQKRTERLRSAASRCASAAATALAGCAARSPPHACVAAGARKTERLVPPQCGRNGVDSISNSSSCGNGGSSGSSSSSGSGGATDAVAARPGDMVTVTFVCRSDDGEILHSSEDSEPLTFEVGAANFVGNPLFQGFDTAVRGLAIGQRGEFKSVPMTRTDELVFQVSRQHPEIQRLAAAAAEAAAEAGMGAAGGELVAGSHVILANGEPARVVEVADDYVVLDANHPLADRDVTFEVQVVALERTQK